jgi:hypothetical protein
VAQPLRQSGRKVSHETGSDTGTCLLAMLIVDGRTPASTQTPMSPSSVAAPPRIGALTMGSAFLDPSAERRPGALDQRVAGLSLAPHRHWSWLFPNTPVRPFASDPLMRRHWWLDPLLRRHWWERLRGVGRRGNRRSASAAAAEDEPPIIRADEKPLLN